MISAGVKTMILKSIEMQGFKSFADKIYLDFNSGITAIVGPNGSGKSNISDAIRWVMGEQSIKSLRGSKMEDVIFAGTEKRKALGFAEVTLNLNNEDKIFDIDFPEVQVTRRLYRSGESEYYINKTLCRLRDVHELFMDTGLGRDGYSIVGQGQIDSILSTKSEDRRQIFEEASGISKYKYRKNEAEKKLERTTENITRVQDILGELETQLEPLKRQSEKAKKYLVFRDEMKELEINVSVINIERKRASLKKLKQDIDIYSSQITDLEAEISQNDEKVSSMYAETEKIDRDSEAVRESEKQLIDLMNTMTNRNNLAENDIEHSKSTIERLRSEIDESGSRSLELDRELEELTASLDSLNTQSAAIEKTSVEMSDKSRQAGMDVSEHRQKIDEIKNDILKRTAEADSQRSLIESKNILIDNFTSRTSVIRKELEEKDLGLAQMNDRLRALCDEIDKTEEHSQRLKEKINSFEEQYGVKNASMQKLISEKNQNSIKLGQLTSKRKMLVDMEQSLDGYSRGVKGIMNAYKKNRLPGVNIRGPLAQLIKTDKKYIVAIETALGGAAQNIVTDTAEDAKAAIKYLKQNNLGRATFLPVSNIKGRAFNNPAAEKLKGYIGTADSLVEFDETYRNIVSSVLSGTVIVDNIDNAVAMGKRCAHKFKIVTLGGDVVQAGGAMTGGSVAKSTGSLSRTGEIHELETQIKELEKVIVGNAKDINSLSMETNSLLEDIKNNNDRLSSYNEQMIKLSSEKDHLCDIINSGGTDREKLTAELENMEQEIKTLNSEIAEKRKLIKSLEDENEVLRQKSETEARIFSELSDKNDELMKSVLELSIRKNSVLKDIEQANERIQRINAEKSQLLTSSSEKQSEIQSLSSHIESSAREIEERKAQIEETSFAISEANSKLDELSKKRQSLEADIKRQQESVNDVRTSLLNLSKLHAKAQTKYENADSELEGIINHLWEEYELTYNDALKNRDLTDFDYQSASKRITELRKSIKALGNINIDAIEEYKNVKERTDFLTEQVTDLEKSKKELNKIITEMLAIMKERFSSQFKIINENFNRVFVELFGGGQAELSLVDPDNVLESGIEIEAQPPGKKLQSLTLLSGGERAFTAIALLFAILDVRPTPFCILDEIEAALDDVNVYRFAEFLKQYSKKTQFIVVTHRRGTMEAANILYGVTMQEKGISKMLTLNIDEVSE